MTGLTRVAGLAIVATSMLFVACSPEPTSPVLVADAPQFSLDGSGSGSFQFDPIAGSAACVSGGSGDRFVLPAGYSQEVLVRQSDIASLFTLGGSDLFDMNTLNETGPHAGRYLYRTHEVSGNGAVSRTDLWTGETVVISEDPSYTRLDGIAWTPWHTLLFAEETSGGRIFEYVPASGQIVDRSNLGLRAHEGVRVDAKGSVYGISETTPGYIFRFTPDRRGDLSSGRAYALKVADPSRTGAAVWVEIDLAGFGLNSTAAAAAVGATGWGRPEDVEIATSTGGNASGSNVLYVAMTSEDLIVRVRLDGDDAWVSNFISGVPGFENPDNLALSPSGDLVVAEDNGPGDLWFAKTGPEVATSVVRFASLSDCGAEPTGIYFDRNGSTLFVNVQHASWEGNDDLLVAIRPSR